MWPHGPGSCTADLCSTAPAVRPKLSSQSPQLGQNAVNSLGSRDMRSHRSALSGTFENPLSRELRDGLGIKINFSWIREGVSENWGSFPLILTGLQGFGGLWPFVVVFLVILTAKKPPTNLHEQY